MTRKNHISGLGLVLSVIFMSFACQSTTSENSAKDNVSHPTLLEKPLKNSQRINYHSNDQNMLPDLLVETRWKKQSMEHLKNLLCEAQKSLAASPHNPLQYNRKVALIAVISKQEGRLEKRIEQLNRSILTTSHAEFESSRLFTARSYAHQVAGNWRMALKDAIKALELAPDLSIRKARVAFLTAR